MEIFQPSFRGKNLGVRKDSTGKYIEMSGTESLLFVPISALPNVTYRVKIEMAKKSGNGIVYCNIYGNPSYDFPQVKFTCDSADWVLYSFNIRTLDFPKLVPMVFRLWRKPGGTGSLFIRKIIVELLEEELDDIGLQKDKISAVAPALPEPTMSVEPIGPTEHIKSLLQHVNPANIIATKEVPVDQNELVLGKTRVQKHINFYNQNSKKLKVLFFRYCADSSEEDRLGLLDALIENGYAVCTFCFNKCFKENGFEITQKVAFDLCEWFQPDWIHMILQFYSDMIAPETIQKIAKTFPKTKITNYTFDVRSEPIQYYVDIGKFIDKSLIPSTGQLQMYRDVGCQNVEFWNQAYDPKYFYMMSDNERKDLNKELGHDIVFCANRNTAANFPGAELREKIAISLSEKYGSKFALYGRNWYDLPVEKSFRGPCTFKEQNKIYNGSKIILSINHFNNIEDYCSNRQFIAMATGTLTLCSYFPGIENIFKNHEDVVWFKNEEECIDLCDYYLNHPEKAEKIGRAGAAKAKQEHTFFKRVEELSCRLGLNPKEEIIRKPDKEIHLETEILKGENVKKFVSFDGEGSYSPKVLFLHFTDNNINQMGLTEGFIDNGFKICTFCFNGSFDENGFETTQKAILALGKTFQPDWIHMQLQFFHQMVAPDTIKRLREICPNAYITNWTADIRSVAVPYFVEIGKLIHRPLITSEGQLNMYRDAGCKNVDYWQIGFDPNSFYRKTNIEREALHSFYGHNIAFCANRNTRAGFPGNQMREDIAIGLSRTFGKNFGLYGHKWDIPEVTSSLRRRINFYEQNNIYNGSNIVVSSNHYNNVRKYFSDRQLVSMATGTLTISNYIPGLEEYFSNHEHLVWFNTPSECVDLCKYYLNHPDEAEKIGTAGANKVKQEHTYFKRVEELAKRLGFK